VRDLALNIERFLQPIQKVQKRVEKIATLSKVQVGIWPKQDSNFFFSKHGKYFP
jgi:hypothetical protein